MLRIRLLLPFWMNAGNIETVANRCGWPFLETRGPSEVSEERIWTTADGQTFVSYVSDFGLQMTYLVVQGQAAESVAADLGQVFPVIGRDDVVAMRAHADSPDAWIHLLYQAAAVSREDREDSDLLAIFEAGLTHPDEQIRRAAVFASTYAGWSGLREPLEHVASADANADVRTMAESTLESLRQHVWGGKLGA